MKTEHQALLFAVISGGLVAGTVDIGAAALINWLSPVTILHAVASGLLGKQSFTGGGHTAILGLVLQWGIAIVIAATFVTTARRFRLFIRRWIASGISYGVMIFLVMNYVVVPLSAAPWNPWKQHFRADKFFENLLAMILFGLIVAFCARYFIAKNTAINQDKPSVTPT